MGTLFNQEPRSTFLKQEMIISRGKMFKEVARELEISFSEAIELYLAVAKINDYDIKDEQLAGFGDLINDLKEAIKVLH
jgi:cytidylate kinase